MCVFIDGARELRRLPDPDDLPRYRTVRLAPVTALIGAEVHGVDLARVSDETFVELHTALLEWKVLFFRDQDMSSDEQIALAQRWGELDVNPFFPMGDVASVSRLARDENVAGRENVFHADHSFLEHPSFGAILRAIEVPPQGGDTIWVDMAAAYDNLTDEVKQRIDGQTAVHDWIKSHGRFIDDTELPPLRESVPPVEHPLVVRHPETGRKTLYVNEPFTMHIVGMDPLEAEPLLAHLVAQARVPEYQVRFRWQPNSVAIWDNRGTQHYAVNDYYPARRVMERVAIASGNRCEHRPSR